jgi:hypothetical protein
VGNRIHFAPNGSMWFGPQLVREMKDPSYANAVKDRKALAEKALFEYLFLLRHRRTPARWETVVGLALIGREWEPKVTRPDDTSLSQIQEVAAEVLDALTTSEAVMVSA